MRDFKDTAVGAHRTLSTNIRFMLLAFPTKAIS
jgi:hypothetical protein